MRKFLISMFILVLYAASASAQSSFNIVEDHKNLTGGTGQTLSSSFNVANTGTTSLDINFTGYTLTGPGTSLTISSLDNISNLANGSTKNTGFSVVIPSSQTPGKYTGTLTAKNGSLTDTIEINVNVTPTASVSTVSELDLGRVGLGSVRTRTFAITNTGSSDITNIEFKFSNTDFDIVFNKTDFTLAVGADETIEFNITIPDQFSTGNVTLGFVQLESTELNTKLFDVIAEISGGLFIEDLDVFLTTRPTRQSDGTLRSGSESDLDVIDGEKLDFGEEEVGPESELRFNFNIENLFAENEDIDIEGVTITVTVEDIDDGDDIDEESNEFDVDSGKSKDVDVFINIPLSVDEGTYDVIIEVEGEDVNGNVHTEEMNLEFTVKKKSRDVVVVQASLFPEKIKCAGTSTVTATIKNLGSRTEENAKLEITNPELGINVFEENIELEEDPFDDENEFTRSAEISVDSDTAAGTYPIVVSSFILEEQAWDTRKANLVVEACDGVAEGTGEEETTEEVEEAEKVKETEETEEVETAIETEEEITEGVKVPVLKPTTTTEIPLTKRPGFWFSIILLNFLVIAAIAFLVVKAVGKK